MLILGLVGLLLFSFGCTMGGEDRSTLTEKGPIIVASKIDTEGALLGQIIIAMLKANGYNVVDKTEFGPTDIIRKAILNGEIDIYPEYTGNGAFFFSQTDPEIWKNSTKGYEAVKILDLEKNQVVWLRPAPANNTWAIAVRKDLSQQEDMKTMDDFAAYVNRGGNVKLACSEEFVNSPAALPAFQKAYGFQLKNEQLLTLSGGNTAQTEKAAAEKTDGVNMAMAYGTDGSLSALNLTILTDTKEVQPVYEPAPVVRNKIYVQYPQIGDILNPVFASLSLTTLQELNAKIAVEGQPASEVAKNYLTGKGFL